MCNVITKGLPMTVVNVKMFECICFLAHESWMSTNGMKSNEEFGCEQLLFL